MEVIIMAENNQNVTMDENQSQVIEPKTKNDDLDNEPENAQGSQKETLQVFKKASRSKRVRTGFIVGLAGFTGFVIGVLTGKSKKEPTTEEVIDVEPEEETAE
jgi:hypothetical protein